jgi:hypothetical protein
MLIIMQPTRKEMDKAGPAQRALVEEFLAQSQRICQELILQRPEVLVQTTEDESISLAQNTISRRNMEFGYVLTAPARSPEVMEGSRDFAQVLGTVLDYYPKINPHHGFENANGIDLVTAVGRMNSVLAPILKKANEELNEKPDEKSPERKPESPDPNASDKVKESSPSKPPDGGSNPEEPGREPHAPGSELPRP